MNFIGIIIGCGAFLIIGLLHPVVIKSEYHIGKKIWPLFAVGGLVCVVGSILLNNVLASSLLAVLGFSLFWSIHELIEQEERVKKGWYPANKSKAAKDNEKAA
ncbi:MAG: DUF4491 family protein [Oscillospiraceae bacterium]